MKLPKRVTVCEVGTRDGFQIEPEFIPTETKIALIDERPALAEPLDNADGHLAAVGELVDRPAAAVRALQQEAHSV